MRQPINPNFERMRLEAERQRLADLEERAKEIGASLEKQAQAAQRDRDALETENSALRQALEEQTKSGGDRVAELEARAETLAAALAERVEVENQQRDDLAALTERVTKVDASFSEPERLRSAIAPILSGALRDAGTDEPERVASAIAPYIVGTIRQEILNSEDELVEAIHPRLGVLIAAAISNAIEELNRKVDEALPIDRWMAAAKGRVTGGPSAGWLLENGDTFVVKEALLIDRHSGVVLASERSALIPEEHAPDEDLMAGMIAALQGFASEAYGATGAGDFRKFSFTQDTVYLRGSPTKVLAVRCSGTAPPEIERQIDQLLVSALERARQDDGEDVPILVLEDFNTPTAANDDSVSASTIMTRGLGSIAAAIALIWGHGAVQGAHEARWLTSVEQAVTDDASLSPYPLGVSQDSGGDVITVSGLLPNETAKAALEQRIDWLASPVPITLDLALVSETAR